MSKVVLIIFVLLLVGCSSSPPPKHPSNICLIFKQYPKWYWATLAVKKKWRVPVSLQMAFVYQESHFRGGAAPTGGFLSKYIPWLRSSSAEGYAQVLDNTWHQYVHAEKKISADRDNFADAVDFIGWYVDQANQRLRIKKNNIYRQYLAYHEGLYGYRYHSYLRKKWLQRVANKVAVRAGRYRRQLVTCSKTLPKKPWWYL